MSHSLYDIYVIAVVKGLRKKPQLISHLFSSECLVELSVGQVAASGTVKADSTALRHGVYLLHT